MSKQLENAIQYDNICKIVGNLYLDSCHKLQNMETHADSMVERIRAQNSTLIKEAQELRAELEKHNGV